MGKTREQSRGREPRPTVLRRSFVLMTLAMGVAATTAAGQDVPQAPDGSASAAPGGDDNPRVEFVVARATEPVHVDGSLDEPAWSEAAPIPLRYESNPGNNTPAPVDTRCFATFDDRHLYLACDASDPHPDRIRAFITDRDDVDGHDRVVFTLDPFNDARRAFEFSVTALGVQADAIFDQQGGGQNGAGGGGRDSSWDAIWSSAGRITAGGYVVEAAIPFKSLRFPNTQSVHQWGFFVSRQWPRSDAVETRSMVWDRGNSCELCQANLLTGLTDISPGRNLELTPSLTGGRTDRLDAFPEGALEAGPTSRDFGLDALWGITSNLTLNATVNPDFSQVEADAPQLEVNNRFALFFPEKRAFFLEGADFFRTPVQAVFTRTIVDPSFGTKLTGKVGANVVGALVARDDINSLLFPGNQSSGSTTLEQRVTTAVGRFRRDVGSSSTLGGLVTARQGSGYSNRVFGADGTIRPVSALTVRLQALGSETRYPDPVATEHGQPEGSFRGTAVSASVRYDTRNWFGSLDARSFSPGFRADAGFVPQVDIRSVNGWLDRRFWGDGDTWYTRIVTSGGFWHNESTSGRLNGAGLWANLSVEGPHQSNVWINPNLRRQHFEGFTYEFSQLWFGGGIRPTGQLEFGFFGMAGGEVDFANSREASQVQVTPNVTFRVGRRVDLRLSNSYRRLSTPGGEEVFRANVSQLRAVYNFSPRAFLRAVLQRRTTTRNPEQYGEPVDRSQGSLFSQLLFSYKLNPQSVLFLGYSDNRRELTDFDLVEIPLTQSSRSFFLKLAYAWRP